MRISSSKKVTAGKVCYPWVLIGEYEDGYSLEQGGNDIGDCLARLERLESKHGDLIWYGGLNDEEYVDGEYIGQDKKLMSSRQISGARSVSWDDLSGADQMAVEYARQYMAEGEDMKEACRRACNDVGQGNSEPEYEDEDFYMDEPDFNNVYDYIRSKYFKIEMSSGSDVRTFRNKRNPNKYLETKKYDDGHTVSRGYMKWNTDRGEVKNYMGSVTNKGRWHRTRQSTLNDIVDDYDQVEDSHTDMDVFESTEIYSSGDIPEDMIVQTIEEAYEQDGEGVYDSIDDYSEDYYGMPAEDIAYLYGLYDGVNEDTGIETVYDTYFIAYSGGGVESVDSKDEMLAHFSYDSDDDEEY